MYLYVLIRILLDCLGLFPLTISANITEGNVCFILVSEQLPEMRNSSSVELVSQDVSVKHLLLSL